MLKDSNSGFEEYKGIRRALRITFPFPINILGACLKYWTSEIELEQEKAVHNPPSQRALRLVFKRLSELHKVVSDPSIVRNNKLKNHKHPPSQPFCKAIFKYYFKSRVF